MFESEVLPVDSKRIGERAREARKKSGLTQVEFAQRISSSPNMIGCVELGKTISQDRWLQKVSAEGGVSLQWFLPKDIEGNTGYSISQRSELTSTFVRTKSYGLLLRRQSMRRMTASGLGLSS